MADADLSVHVNDIRLSASWVERNLRTRGAIEDALPLEGEATRWGDELYYRTPVDVTEEDSQQEVPVGAIAYWPQGNALCLFWGPTPASTGDRPAAASPVNVVAELEDVTPLEGLDDGAHVRVDHID